MSEFISSLPKTCAASYEVAYNAAGNAEEMAYDRICQRDCGTQVAKYMNKTCLDEFHSLFSTLACLKTNGLLGSRCHFMMGKYFQDAWPFFNAVWLSCYKSADNHKACPNGCKDALVELSSQLGCCYKSVYYGDVILDSLFIDGELSIEQGEAFEIIGADLWENCDVPLVTNCAGDPFDQTIM